MEKFNPYWRWDNSTRTWIPVHLTNCSFETLKEIWSGVTCIALEKTPKQAK